MPAANRGTVRLPGHLATEEGPGIAKEDLHPTFPKDGTRLDGNTGGDHPKAIKDHYARVKFAPLDGNGALTVDTWGRGDPLQSFIDLAACNNCLLDCGDDDLLDSEEVYFSMRRLMARMQTQNGAFLGHFAQRRWWIANPGYVLKLDEATNYIGDETLSPYKVVYGIKSGDRTDFLAATVTIHLVQSVAGGAHFSLLIHHVPTGNTWYMDSSGSGRQLRFNKAKEEFQQWLQKSGLPDGSTKNPPPVHRHRLVPVQNDPWSCGLHCIMNALIFVRFGVFGWDRVGAWNDPTSAMDALKKSLHHTLGIQYPPKKAAPKKTRVQPPRKSTRVPKPIQTTKPTKPTKLVQPPSPTNHPIRAKMRPKPPIKTVPKGDPKYEAIRLATLPGGTDPNAPTPDMLRELSSSPDLPSTAPISTAPPPPPAPTGGPSIPARHKTRSPHRPEEPTFVPGFDDDVMDLDNDDADDDQSPLLRRAVKRRRRDVTPTPTRTAKRRRTEAAVTPPGRRTGAAVTPPGRRTEPAVTPPNRRTEAAVTPPGQGNDESARSTVSTPPSAKRHRERVLAYNQAQTGRRESFKGAMSPNAEGA